MNNIPEKEQPIPARVISIEDARQFSQEVAAMEEELVSSMKKHIADGREFGGFLSKDNEAISFGTYDSKIRGIGIGYIGLNHYLNPNPQAKEVDVQTNNVLMIGVHTDMQTMPKVRDLHEKKVEVKEKHGAARSPIENQLYTQYYFDKDGSFAKIVFIPYDIQDNRPTIKGFENNLKFTRGVKGEMTSLDVELVGFGLTRLKDLLRPPQ